MSSSSRPLSSATLKTSVSTPCLRLVEVQDARRAGAARGRETVARTGWPCSPKTSQNTTGNAGELRRVDAPIALRAAPGASATSRPAWLIPARSPFTSAMNTGTPMALKRSAITCSVTVLPVPVAPVIRPWRFASAGSSASSRSPCRAMDEGIGHLGFLAGSSGNVPAVRRGSRRRAARGTCGHRHGAGRRPAEASNPRCFLLQSQVDTIRNGLGAAHFFLRFANVAMGLGELLERTVPALGYELVDWDDVPGRGAPCASSSTSRTASTSRIARGCRNQLTRLFAVENIDFERLEVSSPGLDRPLKQARRLRALRGQEAQLTLSAPVDGARRIKGILRGVEGDDVLVETAKRRAGRSRSPTIDAGAAGARDRVEKRTMNRELLLLVDALSREKNVPKDIVFTALEAALASATKKKYADDIDARVSIDRETGDYETFRRWTVVPDEEHEEPAHQIAITDAAQRDPPLAAGRRRRGAARAGRIRPHRRAGGEAGDPAEDPRRRARADPQRLPRARGQPADRNGQAHRARQRDRRIGPDRGRDSARPADPEGNAARRRPRPRLRDEDRPHREGPAADPVAHRARIHHAAVRARGARDRGGPDRDQGGRARSRHPREDRRQVERSAARSAGYLHRHARLARHGGDQRARRRARRHRAVVRRPGEARDQRAGAGGGAEHRRRRGAARDGRRRRRGKPGDRHRPQRPERAPRLGADRAGSST